MTKEDQIRALKEARAAKAAVPLLRKGRPLAKDADKSLAALKPWVKAGMSRATWFRRQKAETK